MQNQQQPSSSQAETWWRFTACCHTETVAQGRLRADALDDENVVFGDHCFLKVLVDLHDCCEEHIEVHRNGI